MSRHVSIDILGDSASAERAFLRTSQAAKGFSRSTNIVERDFSRMTRGVLSGSGVFTHLGRSLAFASGGFLAFSSASAAIRKSLDAAEETEKAFKGLAAQAKASSETVTSVFGKVGKLTGPALQLGFNKTDVAEGFTVLLRGSGSATKAFKELGAAEDVARAKGLTLSQAAFIVNRALISSGNSARSLGIHFPKAATAAEKLAIILQKYRGQAFANTTEQDRFNATLFNTEEIIGRTLLPVLNKYLQSLGNWLQKLDESGRLQHDVQRAVNGLNEAIHVIGGTVKNVDRVTGSFGNTLKVLAGIFLLVKARAALAWLGMTSEITAVSAAELRLATTTSTVTSRILAATGEMDAAFAGVAASANGAAAAAGRVGAAGAAGAGIGAAGSAAAGAGAGLLTRAGGLAGGITAGFSIGEAGTLKKARIVNGRYQINLGSGWIDAGPAPGVAGAALNPFAPNRFGSGNLGLGALLSGGKAKTFDASVKAASRGTSLLGQFNLLELKLADAQRANNTVLQRSILVSEEKLLVQLESQAKTLKDRTGFAQQAAGIASQIRSLDSANLSADKKAASAAKKAADAAKKKAAEAAKKAAAFSVPLELQVADARAQALGKSETTILQKIKAAAYKALRSGRLGLQGQLDAWNEIGSINQQLQTAGASALNGFKQANVDQIAKSVGLTGQMAKKLKAQLSQLGPGGTIPSRGVGAFGHIIGGDGRPIVVHTHVKLDGREVGRSVTRHQQKDRTRNPAQRRGPHAGGGI